MSSTSTRGTRNGSNGDCHWVEYRSSSGSKYYIHSVTKEKIYEKPLELASPSERVEILEKRDKQRKFFSEMENNISRRLSSASAAGTRTSFGDTDTMEAESKSSYDKGIDGSKSADSKTNSSHFVPDSDSAGFLETFFDFNKKGKELMGNGISGAIGAGGPGPGPGSGLGMNSGRTRTISSLDLTTISQADDASVYTEVENLLGVHGGISMQADSKTRTAPFLSDRKFSFDGNEFELPTSLKDTSSSKSKDGKGSKSKKKQKKKRRNSTGTTYVSATLMKQDNDITIMCVCRVLHAYILDAFRTKKRCTKEFTIFKDAGEDDERDDGPESYRLGRSLSDDKNDDWTVGTPPISSHEAKISNFASSRINSPSRDMEPSSLAIPSADTIYLFFQCIFRTSQLETECIIIALIYLERLMKETNNGFCICHDNWHSAVFVCLMMASKVWDDLSMWNSDFSQIIPGYDLDRLNSLELCVLDALHYDMKVPPGQYAKYYFILRSLISQLGLSTATDTEELLEGSSLDLAKSKAMSPMAPIHINFDKVISKPKLRGKGIAQPVSMPDLLLALDHMNVASSPTAAPLDTHMRSLLEAPTYADGTRVQAPKDSGSNNSSGHSVLLP